MTSPAEFADSDLERNAGSRGRLGKKIAPSIDSCSGRSEAGPFSRQSRFIFAERSRISMISSRDSDSMERRCFMGQTERELWPQVPINRAESATGGGRATLRLHRSRAGLTLSGGSQRNRMRAGGNGEQAGLVQAIDQMQAGRLRLRRDGPRSAKSGAELDADHQPDAAHFLDQRAISIASMQPGDGGRPASRAFSSIPSSSITASTSFAPAQTERRAAESGAVGAGPSRSQSGLVSPDLSVHGRSLTQMAPSGKPPAMPFAQLIASGMTSGPTSVFQPHQSPVRPRPHCTSSNMSSRPWRSQSSRASLQELGRWQDDAALALDRLEQHGDRAGLLHGGEQRGAIIERHVGETLHRGSKPFFTFSCPVAAMPASVRPWKEPSMVMISCRYWQRRSFRRRCACRRARRPSLPNFRASL